MKATVFMLLSALGGLVAEAHPVAQGTVEITLADRAVQLHVRVSPEEVFVANSHANPPLQGLEETYQAHGTYLLDHLRLFIDEQQLSGKLVSWTKPQPGEPYASYQLVFPTTSRPTTLRLQQNVLNEINYAPGNRWEATYLVSAREQDRTIASATLLSSKSPLIINVSSSSGSSHIALDYVRHGINHILTGYDHLLFIAALALAVTSFWELFKIIAAFTLAHTITLTVSVLNIIRLPSHIVEPMIAASIVVVALQNVLWPRQSHGRARLVIAFFFGLFHGLGFAGGLLDAMSGMAGVSIALAIAAFSIGVELGHQCVVLPLFGLVKLTSQFREDVHARAWLLRGGSALISAAGVFYLVAAVAQASGLRWSR